LRNNGQRRDPGGGRRGWWRLPQVAVPAIPTARVSWTTAEERSRYPESDLDFRGTCRDRERDRGRDRGMGMGNEEVEVGA